MRRRRWRPAARRCSRSRARRWRIIGTISIASSSGATAARRTLILDDGGDATLLIISACARTGRTRLISKPTNEEEVLFAAIKQRLKDKPGWYKRNADAIRGVTEETTTGVHRLYEMQKKGTPAVARHQRQRQRDQVQVRQPLRLPRVAGRRHPPRHRRDDGGKVAMVAGFGDVGKGSAASLRQAGCRVLVSEIDPICALQAAMEGYEVTTMEERRRAPSIFVTATGNLDVITIEHMRKMKDRAVVANIGHFDSEIQVATLRNFKWHNVKPQVDEIEFPDGKRIILLSEGRLVNLGNAMGHPSFVMSSSFTNQMLAQIELWTNPGKYEKKVYTAAQAPRREGGAAASRQDRRQAHEMSDRRGDLYRRAGERDRTSRTITDTDHVARLPRAGTGRSWRASEAGLAAPGPCCRHPLPGRDRRSARRLGGARFRPRRRRRRLRVGAR